jgi:cysteine desulfuration protein SufE
MTASEQPFLDNPLGRNTTLDDVVDAFEFLDDWEDRYAYIIDLGKQLPAFPDDERVENNYVHGCQSQVWLIHLFDEDSGKLYLLIDSDAMIVRGLAAIILVAMNGKTPRELLTTDVD